MKKPDFVEKKTVSDNGPIVKTEAGMLNHTEIAPIAERVFTGVSCQNDVNARVGDFMMAVAADGWRLKGVNRAKFWYEGPNVVSCTNTWTRKIK